MVFGSIGLYLLYKIDNKRFKLIFIYLIIVITIQFLFGDVSRGFQYTALPMAILSGLTMQKGYEYVSKNYRATFSMSFMAMLLVYSLIGSSAFFAVLLKSYDEWNDLDIPFEHKYAPLKSYIERNTNKNDVLWVDQEIADKVAWMTGRRVSNGRYGAPRRFVEKHQKINIYISNNTFLIKDFNNKTLKQIKIISVY